MEGPCSDGQEEEGRWGPCVSHFNQAAVHLGGSARGLAQNQGSGWLALDVCLSVSDPGVCPLLRMSAP